MKYLEYTPLDRINDFLSNVNLGERTIEGCLEAYSCKHTGSDKKLCLSLENEILSHLGKSSDTDSSSPVEFLLSSYSRKTLIYLLLTLHHMYPDFDFSAVRAHEFFTEENWESFKQIFMFTCSSLKVVTLKMVDMKKQQPEWLEENEGSSLLETLYKALDEVVKLTECEIYSYNPEAEADPFIEKGAINLASGFYSNESSQEEDGVIFDGMDI